MLYYSYKKNISCCVDTVAAEHYEADCIVHFGHSCLSLVDKIPVFYVTDKFPIDLELVAKEVDLILSSEKLLIILYDVGYSYVYGKICLKNYLPLSKNKFLFSCLDNLNLKIGQHSNVKISKMNLNGMNEDEKCNMFFSRCFPKDLENSEQSYAFFYIGSKESFLNPFLFYFNRNKFYHFNPIEVKNKLEKNKCLTETILFAKTNRELMKRYYLVEKARDSRIFGILIGTMSVAKCKKILHAIFFNKKKKSYFNNFL